jgi:hypothetical protein
VGAFFFFFYETVGALLDCKLLIISMVSLVGLRR